MDVFSPTLTPPNLFIGNQINYKHKVNMDLYPETHESYNLEKIGMC